LFLLLFFFPRLISAAGDWMSTILPHMVWRIYNAGMKCAARGSLEIQDAKNRHFGFWHHCTTLSGYIFGTKECIDNRKKNLFNSNTSSTCPDNIVNFGLLTAEICWRVCGTPANFNGFRILAALLHGTLVVGVSQTLRRVEQRVPPIFSRAAITLGIGPHSSLCLHCCFSCRWWISCRPNSEHEGLH